MSIFAKNPLYSFCKDGEDQDGEKGRISCYNYRHFNDSMFNITFH